jgi:arylsulfatase A-like enzyme
MAENVLLITIDSLRADHVGLQDGQNIAPNITPSEDQGTYFSQAIANGPNTPSSFPSILTGTLPLMYGGYHYLDNDRSFLAKKFESEGYTTVGYHSNPHLGENRNYDAGFSTFNDSAEGSDIIARFKDSIEQRLDSDSTVYSLLRRMWHYFTLTTDSSAYARAPTITENALNWFDEACDTESPFFMWLHYMDVHYPFTPPDHFFEELGYSQLSKSRIAELNGKMQESPGSLTDEDVDDLLKLYDGEIRFTDHYIGELLDYLEQQDILDETIVIITADHGEAFGEHGRFGHHPYLYDELLQVPMIVYAPMYESRVIDQQVSLLDLGPSLCDMLEIDIPEAMQGASFEPLLRGEDIDEEVAIATGMDGQTLACRTSGWKCFWKVKEEKVELYDLRSDPNELDDVSTDNPTMLEELQGVMENYLDEAEQMDIELPEMKESPEVRQRLRELGYVD